MRSLFLVLMVAVLAVLLIGCGRAHEKSDDLPPGCHWTQVAPDVQKLNCVTAVAT